jgi:phage/plasmid-associated DNA primase
MRTKLLKFGMPLMAFLLAIVFAFATNPKTVQEDLALVNGYIMQNGKCTFVRTCSNVIGPKCTVGGSTLRTKINETQCGSELYHWNNG